jgi:hypothetical protein
MAAQGGHEKVVERLLAAKAEVNAATQVRDEARADQARPQPALRPAVTKHTGQSRARVLCQQDLVAGSLPPRRCIRRRRSFLAWVNGLHLGPGLHLRKGSVTCDVRRVFRCSESCRTAAQRRRLELYARRLLVPAPAPS